jgi:hypothetical protein
MRAFTHLAMLLALLSYATNSTADANDGDLFGYSLGDRYTEQQNEPDNTGRLILFATQNPVKPATIEKVYVAVTPVSRTIGKIAGEAWFESGEDALVAYERFRAILRNKYEGWQSEERNEQHMHATRFWAASNELNVQVSGPHRGDLVALPEQPFRLQITLSYQPTTAAAVEFERLANGEIEQSAAGKYTEDELQGL